MSDLIEALLIFKKYADATNPTNTSHDTLWIMGVDPESVTATDHARLEELGFFVADDAYASHRFGSA